MTEAVKEGRSLARSAGLVSALTMLSRLLGLVRELVFAALLGAGLHADAFQVAYRIPNLLRDLFAEGALSAAFVPTYARTLLRDGASDARIAELVTRCVRQKKPDRGAAEPPRTGRATYQIGG